MKSREIWTLDELPRLVNRQFKLLGKIEEQARRTGDRELVAEVQHKRRHLTALQNAADAASAPGGRSIFISYPKRLAPAIAEIKRIAEVDFGFDVIRTGFDPDVAGAKTLKAGILHAISSSSAFLGVWADDVRLKSARSRQNSAPGVWMPIELGMALALDKPYRLMIKDGMSAAYITPVIEQAHAHFAEDEDIPNACRDALRALTRRLDELDG